MLKMFSYLKRINLFANTRQTKAQNRIHTRKSFYTILLRERVRCDRNGHGFSLVVFDMGEKNEEIAEKLVKELFARRLRMIDDVGWCRNQNIGAILHNTDREGALSFAKDIQDRAASKSLHISWKVFVYPIDWQNIYHDNGDFREDYPPCKSTKGNKMAMGGTVLFTRQNIYERRLALWKRVMDITGSILGFAVLFPLFIFAAIMIKVVSSGPVFFNQKRVGYLGKIFIIWKFRTMESNCDTSIHQRHVSQLINSVKLNDENEKKSMVKLDKDPNIIPFGIILRKLCIDELPQLINVFRGEMSLVGPRPPIPYEVDEYLRWYNGRLDAVPGLTGLWQVSGKNRLTFDQMMRLDIKYSRQISFWLDVKIILMTPVAIISQIKYSLQKRTLKVKGVVRNV